MLPFQGKKILYVHGFGSSGASNTVKRLRNLLPEADILAPDLPIMPDEALALLRTVCEEHKPALIIGTSMGGMYAELLHGYDRILVNPAFEIHETLRTNVGLGKVTFFSPRQDGIQEFMLTKQHLTAFKEVVSQCFAKAADAEEQNRVYGLFGRQDDLVHTRPLFATHYPHAIDFEGGHRLSDSILLHSVMPLIQRIHEKQENISHPTILIDIKLLLKVDDSEFPNARNAFETLSKRYKLFMIGSPRDAQRLPAFEALFGVYSYRRSILTDERTMLLGDYLIEPDTLPYPTTNFIGTRLVFGSPSFTSWDDFLNYFELLGGQ